MYFVDFGKTARKNGITLPRNTLAVVNSDIGIPVSCNRFWKLTGASPPQSGLAFVRFPVEVAPVGAGAEPVKWTLTHRFNSDSSVILSVNPFKPSLWVDWYFWAMTSGILGKKNDVRIT